MPPTRGSSASKGAVEPVTRSTRSKQEAVKGKSATSGSKPKASITQKQQQRVLRPSNRAPSKAHVQDSSSDEDDDSEEMEVASDGSSDSDEEEQQEQQKHQQQRTVRGTRAPAAAKPKPQAKAAPRSKKVVVVLSSSGSESESEDDKGPQDQEEDGHGGAASSSGEEEDEDGDKENGRAGPGPNSTQQGGKGRRAEPSGSAPPAAGAKGRGAGKAAASLGKRNYAEMLGSNIDEATLRATYRSLPGQRLAERAALRERLTQRAPAWHLMLRSGFSLLLHGLGSKRDVLQEVAEEVLTDGAVITCNGFVKSLTAHKVVMAAAAALLGHSCRNVSSTDLLAMIRKEAKEWPDRRVYIVLHSIDGPGLRNESDQAVLAGLAACPNCHLIASMDHVNAPLMWETAIATQFRWVWITAHTYAPYIAETLDKPSVLLGCSHRARQRGARAVLRSMVGNARDVFGLLVAAQLEHPQFEGLDFKQLYRMCRERFLLTSESALKSALTEFTDHELLATRQSADGGELLYVPLDASTLQQVAQELEDIRAEGA